MSDAVTLCALCLEPAKGYAWGADGRRLCHTSDPATDCYSRVREQRVRVELKSDPEFTAGLYAPLEPLSPNPDFIVHRWVMDGTRNLCGREGGRRTVRLEAVECRDCYDLVTGVDRVSRTAQSE